MAGLVNDAAAVGPKAASSTYTDYVVACNEAGKPALGRVEWDAAGRPAGPK